MGRYAGVMSSLHKNPQTAQCAKAMNAKSWNLKLVGQRWLPHLTLAGRQTYPKEFRLLVQAALPFSVLLNFSLLINDVYKTPKWTGL